MKNKYAEKVDRYIGQMCSPYLKIVGTEFRKDKYSNQNRTYFVLENLKTGKKTEKRASSVVRKIEENKKRPRGRAEDALERLSEIIQENDISSNLKIERLIRELRESREKEEELLEKIRHLEDLIPFESPRSEGWSEISNEKNAFLKYFKNMFSR